MSATLSTDLESDIEEELTTAFVSDPEPGTDLESDIEEELTPPRNSNTKSGSDLADKILSAWKDVEVESKDSQLYQGSLLPQHPVSSLLIH